MSDAAPSEPHAADEAENQAMLAHYGAEKIFVVRKKRSGKIVFAAATYADGEQEVLYHTGGDALRPGTVRESFSTSERPGR
jgi:hypothetical protein